MNLSRPTRAACARLLTCVLVAALGGALSAGPGDAVSSVDTAPLFRVFLQDGTTLVSYGEFARLDNRVVFSMPTSASTASPQLQLINIASDRVNWVRTLNYAESVRASQYIATRAAADYAVLSSRIADALNAVGATTDLSRRLTIVENARRALADWPAAHYNYNREQIQQMLAMLDETIAEMRASTGARNFDLTFVAAATAPPPMEPLLPAPDARETLEQTLHAANLTSTPAERLSLLTVALDALERDAGRLPAEWVAATRADINGGIAHERDLDRRYRTLGQRLIALASARAKLGDVRGVQRVLTDIKTGDEALGGTRPDQIASIVATVQEQLDAARTLRLEQDRWALKAPELLAYRTKVSRPLARLRELKPLLEDIKSLAGSGPDALGAILQSTSQMLKSLADVQPPSEAAAVHALIVSAVQLADNAAKIRREAALTGNMSRAWDASSAAAGAMMLTDRATQSLQQVVRPPQLPR
jgi:hypothetical protein